MSENTNENKSDQSSSYLPEEAIGLKSDPALLHYAGERSNKVFGIVQEDESSRRLKELSSRLRRRLARGQGIF